MRQARKNDSRNSIARLPAGVWYRASKASYFKGGNRRSGKDFLNKLSKLVCVKIAAVFRRRQGARLHNQAMFCV